MASYIAQQDEEHLPQEWRDLAAGIAAAPEGVEPEGWLALVQPPPSPDQRRALTELVARLRAVPGTGPGPVPVGRLQALRAELARRGLDGFVVPRSDEHQGEYVPARAERLAWLTGFTGSAGMAVVLADKAAVFVDGRYTLQVESEVDGTAFEYRHISESPPTDWLAENLGEGARLGYDPWLHTPDGADRLAKACERAGAMLVGCADNPLDAVWDDQPPPPVSPIRPHPDHLAGRASAEKRREIGALLAAAKQDAVVLTQPDSLAWLLNIRGGDVPFTPLPLCFGLLYADGRMDLFVDPRKLAPGLAEHLGADVSLRRPEEFGGALEALNGRKVRVDHAGAPAWTVERLQAGGAQVVRGADPCALPKACKNEAELEGTRAAHRRDGAALCRFLAWLDAEAPKGGLTEISAADRLEAFRRENEHFRGLSFPTISGAGPNGAIVHYRVTERTDRRIEPGQIYLLDSGAQYLDGTTDVTRTIAIGTPGEEERRRFTLVLKGHIALARARFPEGTTGSQLDALARMALWAEGLDYDHGTGHGVGSYLGVHEGPQRISKAGNAIALKPGMILSNEPGYYKTGAYGIRIENLVVVREAEVPPGAERKLLDFETLTLAPIDRRLILRDLLTDEEAAWLDAYHARVRDVITPLVDSDTAAWLAQATAPLE
ncbi:aminopeptidase P family protein [Telmatospirillum sp. J64-1]|uniref:aminopeptidase P family protein n=1 Tax=Telmatospirillum sp. J64-1 TaxID=2502183 RepID=UPI00115E700F|nr:aminopeptidase P family protein [Telmatospirillum sp. J64-1]